MARIYETPDDLSRDILKKKIRDAKAETRDLFTVAPLFLIVGGFSRMLRQAKPYMQNMSEFGLWKVFGGNSFTFTAIEWTGYVFAAKSLIDGLLEKHKEKKARKELNELGGEQKVIVQEKKGFDQIVLFDDGKLLKKNNQQLPNQTVTTIQGPVIEAERIRSSINNVKST